MRNLLLMLTVAVGLCGQDTPRPSLTPGATLEVTLPQLCLSGYSKDARGEHRISGKTKRLVRAEYGLDPNVKGFVIDHLISLELGGSNNIRNLWPQTVAEGHMKDRLENLLHRKVCALDMSLVEAQLELTFDWRAAYAKYFHGVHR